jgi:sugar O-acyltransferase (sialic acid O-acetyltransferase NeuD family)
VQRELVIVGAGGLGREVAEAVRAINAVTPTWDLVGFLDDRSTEAVDDMPLLGPLTELAQLPDALVVVCVGAPQRSWTRRLVVSRLGLAEERFARIVHPAAVIRTSSSIGPGSVVLAGVVATTAVHIGAHVAVMPGTIFTHDDVVSDYATFASGVRLSGGVTIGEGAYVGAGAVVREDVTVGDWAVIGMGSVVLDDVPRAEIWAGTPARHLRRLELPDDLR